MLSHFPKSEYTRNNSKCYWQSNTPLYCTSICQSRSYIRFLFDHRLDTAGGVICNSQIWKHTTTIVRHQNILRHNQRQGCLLWQFHVYSTPSISNWYINLCTSFITTKTTDKDVNQWRMQASMARRLLKRWPWYVAHTFRFLVRLLFQKFKNIYW